MSKTQVPSMYVNVTNEQLDKVRAEISTKRYRDGDLIPLANLLKGYAAENGGDFDYRMAILGRVTDLRVIDKPRDLVHIRFETKIE